jgi:hypothetical protein
MPDDMYGADAVDLAGGKILFAGGRTNLYNSYVNGTDGSGYMIFDIATGATQFQFTGSGNLGLHNRAEAEVEVVGGMAVIFGGTFRNGTIFTAENSAEYYDGAKFEIVTSRMAAVRESHTGTALPNGQILLVGGSNGSQVLASSEGFNGGTSPMTGTFVSGPNLNTARKNHTATLLGSGMVLIAGGEDAAGNPLAVVELFAAAGQIVPGSSTPGTGTAPIIDNISPTSGAVGTTVILNGKNFDSVAANNIVRFNGVAAVVTRVSTGTAQHMIECTVPHGASTGPVTVTVGGVTSTTTNPTFTVSNQGGSTSGPPTILIVLPNSGPNYCPVSVTGTNFDSQAIVWFGNVPSLAILNFSTKTLPLIGSVSEIVTLVPPNAVSCQIFIENPGGLRSNGFPFTVQ